MLIDFRHLFPKYNIKPEGVLHIGANVGEEAPIYYELGIKTVLWVEANEQLIPQLRITADKYGHRIWHALVGDVEGLEVKLHISNNAGQSSSILELGTHKIEHPDVHYVGDRVMKMVRLDNYGCYGEYDFLNIDIQGAELKALKGLGDYLNDFRWAYLEVNTTEVYKGCALLPEVEAYMKEFGFRLVETKFLRGCTWGDALFIK